MKKILLLLVILLTACTPKTSDKNNMYQKFTNISYNSGFNTYISLIGYTESQAEFDNYFKVTTDEFERLNQLFDIYNDYPGINNLKTINDNAGIQPVEVDPIIIDMLEIAKEYNDLSNGVYDITIGNLLGVWHDYREKAELTDNIGELPPLELLEQAAIYSGFDKVVIDKQNNTVFITDPNVSLDVGGIAKGYAAEYIANKLDAMGIYAGIIDAGGNNRMINHKPDGNPWKVGIMNPNGNGSLVTIATDIDESFVTSGDYQRFFYSPDGERMHHIINPFTMYPANYYRSVSIITKDSGLADAMSTALYTLPFEDGIALIEEFKAKTGQKLDVVWITDKDQTLDWPNHIVKDNLNIYYTDGIKDVIAS